MLGAEFALERLVESQEAETLGEQARRVRSVRRRIVREGHASSREGSLNETALYVFGVAAQAATPQPWIWAVPGGAWAGTFTRVRQTSSGLHACLRTQRLSRSAGEIPSSFAGWCSPTRAE
jgi:hypothetical protein